MERVVDCPVCQDIDRCFEEVQDDFSSFLCFSCGFMSNSWYIVDSDELKTSLDSSPQLVRDLSFVDDERNIVWFPAVLNMGKRGIIYPEGNINDWSWKYAQVIEIPKNKLDKYEGYESMLDVENATTYGRYEFLQACKDMGITRDIQ
tara:strand:+ start:102 stop:542 length:441 start_codon:yes stop_codon:yes gene_type:complete